MRSVPPTIQRALALFRRIPIFTFPAMRRRSIVAALLIGAAILCNASGASSMEFRLIAAANAVHSLGVHGALIAASGEITDATPEDFRNFLRLNAAANHGRAGVFIDSPGGKIVAGIELGRLFRMAGVTAAVARIGAADGPALNPSGGVCFSACVYAFMGAKRRIAPRASKIGVHRMFAYDGAMRRFDDGPMAAMLRRYATSMGVSPALIAATEQVSPDAIRILTPAEMARWRLAAPES